MYSSDFDLHCHSSASDGELSPEALVQRANDNGVKVLALTDHDTLAGIELASDTAEALGMRLINGIEFSCVWEGHTIHILGLNFDRHHPAMLAAEAHQLSARTSRAEQIDERLMKKKLPSVLERAKALAESGVPGRPHFAQALCDAGVVKDHGEAFKKYLGQGKVGDVKSGWPTLEEVLAWVHEAGGIAVIAHPRKYKMSVTKLRALIEAFVELGGEGMEVVTSGQKSGELGLLTDLCRRYDLCASVGSDFHSPRFAWADLGRIPSLPSGLKPVWELWS